ncbi:unnamed protein product [Orchesella dallaii]|uniref:Uncharacterized protein n=1 Tax=Orchesella dallaii TaxID=48710 RepID=A0ABP1PS92_9HEXA
MSREESNLSSKDNSLQAAEPDYNQNYIPQVQPSIKIDAFKQQHDLVAGSQKEAQATRKTSRKLKKKKNESSKKNRRRNQNVSESRSKSIQKSKINDSENPVPPPPSQIVSFPNTSDTGRATAVTDASSSSKGQQGCRKVDTCMKWDAESMLDTTNERRYQSVSETGVPPLIPLFIKKDKDKEKYPPVNHDNKLQRIQMQQPPASLDDFQNSINVLLARKAPMEKGGDRRRDYK